MLIIINQQYIYWQRHISKTTIKNIVKNYIGTNKLLIIKILIGKLNQLKQALL